MISSLDFATPLGTSYFRNNRSTRQKSMRCFPSCNEKGHISGGKCGVPLCVTINVSNLKCNIEELLFLAEIRPSNEPRMSGLQVVNKKTVMDHLRSKNEKGIVNGEVFLGDSNVIKDENDQGTVEVTFNSQHCSWDYSWKSNRWSGSVVYHVVDIIAMRSLTPDQYLVCSHAESSPFIIASSHKSKPKSGGKNVREVKRVEPKVTEPKVHKVSEPKITAPKVSAPKIAAKEIAVDKPPTRRKRPAAKGSAESEVASVLSSLAKTPDDMSGFRGTSSSSHSAVDDDAARALISLVKPSSYIYDINKSLAQQLRSSYMQESECETSDSDSEAERLRAVRRTARHNRAKAARISEPPEDENAYIILPTR